MSLTCENMPRIIRVGDRPLTDEEQKQFQDLQRKADKYYYAGCVLREIARETPQFKTYCDPLLSYIEAKAQANENEITKLLNEMVT